MDFLRLVCLSPFTAKNGSPIGPLKSNLSCATKTLIQQANLRHKTLSRRDGLACSLIYKGPENRKVQGLTEKRPQRVSHPAGIDLDRPVFSGTIQGAAKGFLVPPLCSALKNGRFYEIPRTPHVRSVACILPGSSRLVEFSRDGQFPARSCS